MPGRDGTGPAGKGRGGGPGSGGGRLGGGSGLGAGGNCLCPKCGNKSPHTRGTPCSTMKCPKCGSAMVRE